MANNERRECTVRIRDGYTGRINRGEAARLKRTGKAKSCGLQLRQLRVTISPGKASLTQMRRSTLNYAACPTFSLFTHQHHSSILFLD